MNYLWGLMILIGVIYGAFTGNLAAVTEAALSSAKEAVTLCITMTGVMAFWVGIMQIAEQACILDCAAKALSPILRFLFPRIPKGHRAYKYIATNMVANIFGLGWAATPAGLSAMKEMDELAIENQNQPSKKASREMCTFLIIHLLAADHTGKYHRLSKSVRIGESILHRRARPDGHGNQYAGRSCLL